MDDIEVMVMGRTVATLARQTEHDRFSPGRYPFTYAYDLLREFNELIPVEVLDRLDFFVNSRSCMAAVTGLWARDLGVDKIDLLIGLADAFLEYHEVIVSGEQLIAAILEARKKADNVAQINAARRQS